MNDRREAPKGYQANTTPLERDLRALYQHPQADARFVVNLEQRLRDQAVSGGRRGGFLWGRWLNRFAPVFAWGALALFAVVALGGLFYAVTRPESVPRVAVGVIPATQVDSAAVTEAPAVIETAAVSVSEAPPAGGASYGERVTTPTESEVAGGVSVPATAEIVAPTEDLSAEEETEAPAGGNDTGRPQASPPPTPTLTPETPALAAESPAQPTQLAYVQGPGLTVEMYPLAERGASIPDFDLSNEQVDAVPETVLSNRQIWRGAESELDGQNSEQLIGAGFRLVEGVLYRDGVPLLSEVQWPNPQAVVTLPWFGTAGKTAGLVVQGRQPPYPYYWVLDGRLLRLDISTTAELTVTEKDQVLYYRQVAPSPAGLLKSIWAWDGHWVLEFVEVAAGGREQVHVIFDGVDLAQTLKVDEVFGWRLVGGQPLYFYRLDEITRVSYAGSALPVDFEEVLRYTCCSAANLSLQSNSQMVWFYARQNDVWHYVEAGNFPPASGP